MLAFALCYLVLIHKCGSPVPIFVLFFFFNFFLAVLRPQLFNIVFLSCRHIWAVPFTVGYLVCHCYLNGVHVTYLDFNGSWYMFHIPAVD